MGKTKKDNKYRYRRNFEKKWSTKIHKNMSKYKRKSKYNLDIDKEILEFLDTLHEPQR